jgi:formylglycine-generating enzyme required for sulfatase activity
MFALALVSSFVWAMSVEDLQIDSHQVTRTEYLSFVREHPEWQKGSALPVFADAGYLASWKNTTTPNMPRNAPVTEVSWFAAKAYCNWNKKRLPTIAEWELGAQADETTIDASKKEAFKRRVLDWYSRPGSEPIRPVKSGYKNIYGLWDMHGLVWEWTEDFNSVILDPEACAANGRTAPANVERDDYANFMRNAFRSSLKANSTTKNLGFRCIKNKSEEK